MSSRIRRGCSQEDCGSRRFYEGDDGFTYCDQGHQQLDRGAVTTIDTGELLLEGRKHRRRGSETESILSKASGLTGTKAFEQYILCLQLVIWKQVRWLIDVRKLPVELEVLTHDLWALRLQQVASRVSYDSETETEAAPSQVFSSQSEGETSASSATTRRSKRDVRADESKKESAPDLLVAVALAYVALLLLREPITVGDLYAWTKGGELLYHRAVQEIPLSMRERLPGTYQELLEPFAVVRPTKLHHAIHSLLASFTSAYGMAFPPINHPLILYRWTRDLALPMECFAGTKRLARLLDMNFSVVTSNTLRANIASRSPEIRLMVLLIVATKLLFPLDDVLRYPKSTSDLSALRMDWTAWVTAVQTTIPAKGANTFANNLNLSSTEIHDLSDEKLDDYLDWYEHTIASEDIRSHSKDKGSKDDADFRRSLFGLFPTGNPDTRQTRGKARVDAVEKTHDEGVSDTLRNVQASLEPRPVVPPRSPGSQFGAQDVNRDGSYYKRYRRVEDLPEDNTAPANLFYVLAAEKAGVELESMVRAVYAIENKLRKVEDELRRKAKGVGQVETDATGADDHSDEDV